MLNLNVAFTSYTKHVWKVLALFTICTIHPEVFTPVSDWQFCPFLVNWELSYCTSVARENGRKAGGGVVVACSEIILSIRVILDYLG